MTEESSFIVQGSVSSVAVAFLQAAVLRMIPFAAPAVVLIVLDLLYGVKAAKHRGERARFSTAVRRSATKLFGYVCWLILASTLALSFRQDWLEWGVLGLVYLNELASIVGNYAETKNVEISWAYLWNKVLHIGGQKAGLDTTEIDVGELVKPKQPRNEKGQFVKKEE